MKLDLQLILNRLASNPKPIFLVDSIGAFLTASVLFTVLLIFKDSFGMPLNALRSLSLIAFMYFIYSAYCYYFVENNWRTFLQSIGIANLLYWCLIVGLLITHRNNLTILCFVYFFLELVVIGLLIIVELKTSTTKNWLSGNG